MPAAGSGVRVPGGVRRPGGAPGLQNHGGAQQSPRWVRFPSASANSRLSVGLTMQRVPQPPVNPALRDVERHDFWPGFVAALIGIILMFCGARHLTGGGYGGWRQRLGNPVDQSLCLRRPAICRSRWRRPRRREGMTPRRSNAGPGRTATTEAPTWKVRVDTAAKTPCPT